MAKPKIIGVDAIDAHMLRNVSASATEAPSCSTPDGHSPSLNFAPMRRYASRKGMPSRVTKAFASAAA